MTVTATGQNARQERAGGVWDYVSVSRLNLWLKCPLAFKLRYIDGHVSPPNPNQFLGRRVHAALEFFYRQRMLGSVLTLEQILSHLIGDWESALASEGNPFPDSVAEQSARQQATHVVAAYLHALPADEGAPWAIESTLRVPLIDPFSGCDLGIPFVGIVDLVLQGPGGRTIVDFKTAARGGRPLAITHELQLSAYSYLLRQATNQVEQGLEIRQLVKSSRPRLERFCYPARTEQELQRLFAVIRAYLASLDRREFIFRPGLACASCEFLETGCRRWAA